MRNKQEQQTRDVKVFLLNIVIGILIFLLIVGISYALGEWSDSKDRGYEENSFLYRMEDGRYDEMVRMYHENRALGITFDKEGQEYYAVAGYYEAASYYKAFTEAGDSARMEIYRRKMEAAAADMGAMSFVKSIIDAKLGLQ